MNPTFFNTMSGVVQYPILESAPIFLATSKFVKYIASEMYNALNGTQRIAVGALYFDASNAGRRNSVQMPRNNEVDIRQYTLSFQQ
jgi:hypothetical protein